MRGDRAAGDLELAGLRADYPGWEIWRRADGVLCARLLAHLETLTPAGRAIGRMREEIRHGAPVPE